MSDSEEHVQDDELPEDEDEYLYRWVSERERPENTTSVSSLSVPLEVTLGCLGVFVFGLLAWACWQIYDKAIRPRRELQQRVRDLLQSDESIKTDAAGDIDLRRGASESGAAASAAQTTAAAKTTADVQTMKLTVPSVGGSSSSNVSSTSASKSEESQPSTSSIRRRTATDAGEESDDEEEETTAV